MGAYYRGRGEPSIKKRGMEPHRRCLMGVMRDPDTDDLGPRPIGPDVLGALLDRHGPALELYARQWCAAPADVVQDALLKLAALRWPPKQVVAWLYRAVRNGALNAARSQRRRRRRESAAAQMKDAWFAESTPGRLDPTEAEAAVRTLPPEQQETIVARIWGGLSFDQIAELTGCGSSTAHRRYAAGLSALKKKLDTS